MPVVLQIVGAAYGLMGGFVLMIDRSRARGFDPVRQGAWYLIFGFGLQVAGMVWEGWGFIAAGGGRPLVVGIFLALGILRAYRLATSTAERVQK